MAETKQPLPRSTCPVCKGERKLVGRLAAAPLEGAGASKAHIWCDECGGVGTMPAGDLAQWRAEAERLVASIITDYTDVDRLTHQRLLTLRAHLAAMPQPDVIGGAVLVALLGALRDAQEIIHLQFCKLGDAGGNKECWKECRAASAAVAQTEAGAVP